MVYLTFLKVINWEVYGNSWIPQKGLILMSFDIGVDTSKSDRSIGNEQS